MKIQKQTNNPAEKSENKMLEIKKFKASFHCSSKPDFKCPQNNITWKAFHFQVT